MVNNAIIAICFGLSVIAWWLGTDLIATVLLTLGVVGLISHIWGMYALSKLEISVQADSTVLSAGQSITIGYHIENNKALPLIWLEICQDVPKNDCLIPDEEMKLREFSEEEANYSGRKSAYMRRMAFLMGNSEADFECRWTGKRRGVYRPSDLVVRSGDGFGLTQSVGSIEGLAGKTFVVWPKLVPVDTSVFLRNIWSGRTGRFGWSEDISVLRDEREYQAGDNWKRIDWRTAARTDELYTKQFEMIRPQSILFIIETATFSDREEALSVAASLIFELSGKGMSVGLSLPATAGKEAVLLRPDDPGTTLERCMYELSDHDCDTAVFDGFNIREIVSAHESAGQVWIISQDEDSLLKGRLHAALSFAAPRLLCAMADGGAASFDSIREASV